MLPKKIHYYTLPLTGHQFKGNVGSMNELVCRFMDWAKTIGISCDEALSLWFNGCFDSTASADPVPGGLGIKSWSQIKELAESAQAKMPKETEIIDITNFY